MTRPRAGWRNDYRMDAEGHVVSVHIRPVKDLQPHRESVACWCEPRQEHYEGTLLVIHNSQDGRELVEKHGLQ